MKKSNVIKEYKTKKKKNKEDYVKIKLKRVAPKKKRKRTYNSTYKNEHASEQKIPYESRRIIFDTHIRNIKITESRIRAQGKEKPSAIKHITMRTRQRKKKQGSKKASKKAKEKNRTTRKK